MTTKPKFCPVCYTDVSKCKVWKKEQPTGIKEVVYCPKCNIQLNCDKDSVNVRCPNCNRLFSDTLTFIDHLDKNVCKECLVNG